MRSSTTPERRAERLLRLYPRAWRDRYGEEFAELLIEDLLDQPRSWRRVYDVVRGAMVARLSELGLCGFALAPAEQVRATVAAIGCSAAVFAIFGAAMWSQLTIGWQWSEPNALATTMATVITSLAVFALLGLAVLAAVPIVVCLISHLVRRTAERLVRPLVLCLLAGAFLFAGSRHFGNGWPGTGGHHWAHQSLVPGGLAAFSWASTLSVSSYWAHPAALARFPTAELAWMALSPLALIIMLTGLAKTVRRLALPARLLRFETRLAGVASAVMVVFLTGCCLWVVDGGPGPGNLFHAGAIDVAGILALILCIALTRLGVRRARLGMVRELRTAS